MLRGMHKASASFLGKWLMAGVMGLITVSFTIWGIGDIFRGFGKNAVATIGSTDIGIEQFRQYYTDRVQQLGRRLNRPLSPDQARALGLDRQILGQLIAETALDQQVRSLRLGISDEEIANRIVADPNFRGATGQFDRGRFEQIIRSANFNESSYIVEQHRVTLRRQIAQSISGELKVPTTTLEAVDRYQRETRALDYVVLGPAQAGDIPKPAADVLGKFFEERKVLFRAPEYRKITLLALSAASQAHPDAVPDADAKAYYEQHKGSYGTPEKRELRQIVFPKPEDATAAAERIAKGLSFNDLAKERGLKESDTLVGMVSKSEVIDPAIAAAAFALKPDVVSAPVQGQFGTALLMVSKIEAGTQKSYEDVAPEIKRMIAETRARATVGGLRDKVEDERAAGSTLAEAAKKVGLTARTIDAIDRSGRAPDGTVVADVPKQPDVVASSFATDVGVDNDALQLPEGGYLWYDVNGITPSRERTLDEVKDQVEARWRDDEIAKRLQAKADDMLAKLKAGTPLAQVASQAGGKVETTFGVQRGKPTAIIPAKVLDVVFRTAKGAFASADGDKPTERIVFRVTDVIDPKLDPVSAEAKALTGTLQNSYADDILGQYIARLESDLGVTINQQAFSQVIGGTAGGQ